MKRQSTLSSFVKKSSSDNIPVDDAIWDHPLFGMLTDESWRKVLAPVVKKYVKDKALLDIAEEYKTTTIYPPQNEIFSAFNTTPFEKVKVVIIGQDPYIKEKEAHGLCFSVNQGVKIPPSLLNIYKELERTLEDFKRPSHGYLLKWAEQGVLMLNAALTVRKGSSNTHAKQWKAFTDDVIRLLGEQKKDVVYLLWGKFAHDKAKGVNGKNNCILKAPHPSPLSKGFSGCDHFVLCNDYLKKIGKTIIDWKL
ncbi:Uracil-DNA glycosylase [Entamoeba marina]